VKTTILTLALAVAAATGAKAATITGLCNTGMDTAVTCGLSDSVANENNNTPDLNWVAGLGGENTGTFFLSVYYPDSPSAPLPLGADWIGTWQSGTNVQNVGLYDYIETVTTDTTGGVVITGMWATDNCGQIVAGSGESVTAGGTLGGGVTSSTCNSASSNYNSLTPFSITLAGNTTYQLDFQVYNSFPGPTAL